MRKMIRLILLPLFLLLAIPSYGQDSLLEVKIVVGEGVKFYRNSTGFRNTRLSDSTRGIIIEFGAERVQIRTDKGSQGWVKPQKIGFEEDPTEFLESLSAHRRRMFLVGETVWKQKKILDDMLSELTQLVHQMVEQDSLKKQRTQEIIDRGLPIAIKDASFTKNSAGGQGLLFKFSNTSGMVIKYVNLVFEAFNPVGDRVTGNTSGESTLSFRLIGPIEPGKNRNYDFREDPSFYGATATCFELNNMIIDFMDGSSIDATDPIPDLMTSEFSTVKSEYGCPYHTE